MRRLPSYSNVVASVALFVALGGTSYAVIKLPRDSVGTREVKNRSLRAVDLATGAVPAGRRGPRGSQGPDGTPGAPGARGPSDIVTASRGGVAMASTASTVDAVTINVPAGSWWVLGSTSAVYEGAGATGNTLFKCALTFNGEPGAAGSDAVIGVGAGAANAADLTVHEGRQLATQTAIKLRCGHAAVPGGDPRLDFAQLSAIRTENLEIQPG